MQEKTLPPIPYELFLRLAKKKAAVSWRDSEDFRQGWNDISPAGAEDLRSFFRSAQLRDLQVGEFPFRRFDVRYLPALIFHDGHWFLAELPMGGSGLILTQVGQPAKVVSPNELMDALVVWVRFPQPADDAPAIKDNRAAGLVWRTMFSSENRKWLPQIFFSTIIINLFAVFTSIFAMQVYDRVVPTNAVSTLTTLVVGMLVVIFADWWLKLHRARIMDSLASDIDKKVSQHVFDYLSQVQLDMIPRSLGQVAAQVQGLDAVRNFFSSTVIFVLLDLPFALFFLFFIWVIGKQVALAYLFMVPLAAALGFLVQHRLRSLTHSMQIRSQERNGLLVDTLRGSETIRANNAFWRFSSQWRDINHNISKYAVRHKKYSNLGNITSTTLGSLSYIAAIVIGVGLIGSGHITMGALIACGILGSRVVAPFAQLAQLLSQWQSARESLLMVDSLLKLPTGRENAASTILADRKITSLVCENLSYSYPSIPVKQLYIPRLELRSGDRILLAGPVGSGKTTLLRLLAGLFPPTEGRIMASGVDIWSLDQQVYVSQVGYLPQAVSLFKDSLRNNLSLSGLSDDNRVVDICQKLGIDQIAAATGSGYEHKLDEQGEGLSQGQRQLIGLARLLIHAPRVWLLDEPTSSLDQQHEQVVWSALKQFVKDEDIVIVSTHRLSPALAFCNRMLVLSNGVVVRDGAPREVIASLSAPSTQPPVTKTSSNVKGGDHVK